MKITDLNYITVTQFNTYLKNVVSAEDMLRDIFVIGEVEDVKVRGGSAFFVLKDLNCGIPCTAFEISKTYLPKNGELVVVSGCADFYFKAGRISLRARQIIPAGAGFINVEFERLKKRLEAAGYFAESHKKSLPEYISSIAVITSLSGAVIHDFITTVRAKNNYTDIFAYGATVQGVDAAKSIISALKKADAEGYDAIVIARGGGSAEDLSAFNDENLVKAVYDASTPVISAVGHETDVTLCDLAADMRAPTPTAAAEAAAFDQKKLAAVFTAFERRLSEAYKSKIENAGETLGNLKRRLAARADAVDEAGGLRLGALETGLKRAAESKLALCASAVERCAAALDKNNPARILSTGYFRLYRQRQPVFELKELKTGQKIELFDGKFTAKAEILSVNEGKNNEF